MSTLSILVTGTWQPRPNRSFRKLSKYCLFESICPFPFLIFPPRQIIFSRVEKIVYFFLFVVEIANQQQISLLSLFFFSNFAIHLIIASSSYSPCNSVLRSINVAIIYRNRGLGRWQASSSISR